MILDSGDRTTFESGAVRDMREGKGRCDLLPLDIVDYLYRRFRGCDQVIYDLLIFTNNGDFDWLLEALYEFCIIREWDYETMLLEVAVHFEEGAKKYGDNNWRKGIPVQCYVDSAIRHYLKFRRGDTDERHDRAFCWNILCAAWTCVNMSEANGYKQTRPKAETETE